MAAWAAGIEPRGYICADADERAALNVITERAMATRVEYDKTLADYLANQIANEVIRRIK